MAKQVILASASPRRRELLACLCADFTAVPAQADETLAAPLSPADTVTTLARRKADAVFDALPPAQRGQAVVIGADTLVCLDGALLGKPRDAADAAAMLRRLSGRRHTVYTGVAIRAAAGADFFFARADVEFFPLTAAEIDRYVASGEPLDKAGAYGIQGRGALLVKGICGDFYTVMGLPVAALSRRLAPFLE